MIDLSKFTNNLNLREGIWRAPRHVDISYPKTANHDFYPLEEESFWFNHRNQIIGKAVSAYAKASRIFLDVGAGNGFTSRYLGKLQFEPIVLEPGADGAVNARRRGLENVVHSTLDEAQFFPNSFSNIGLFDVLEHIEDDKRFLAELKRILMPGGRIFITVPAFNLLWSQNDVNAGHFRRYTLPGISTLAQSIGLRVVYSTYFFVALPASIFCLRSIPFRLGYTFKNLFAKASREHRPSLLSGILRFFFAMEIDRIPKRSLKFGSSCLVIIEKVGYE